MKLPKCGCKNVCHWPRACLNRQPELDIEEAVTEFLRKFEIDYRKAIDARKQTPGA